MKRFVSDCCLMLISVGFSLMAYAQSPESRHIVYATDFGVRANSFENASASITRAIAYCKARPGTTLKLPAGRIDLWPEFAPKRELYISNATENDTLSNEKNIAFLLDDMRNFILEGENTLVVLHGKMVSFAIIGSSDITVKNIRFDYERPTMSEFTVQEVKADKAVLKVHRQSKYLIEDGKLILYGEGWRSNRFHTIRLDTATNLMYYSGWEAVEKGEAREIQPRLLEVTGDFSRTEWQPGNRLSVRYTYRDNAEALIWKSNKVMLRNLDMHYMHGLGIVSQFSENISLVKIRVAPPEASDRIISSFADCFHFSGCRGKILIDSCFTSGAHDDPVNVHGTHLKIVTIKDNRKLLVRFMHHQTWGFEAFFNGDTSNMQAKGWEKRRRPQ